MISRHLALIVMLCLSVFGFGQMMPCDSIKASQFCDTAPIICDIDCLDGFEARMPDTMTYEGLDRLCQENTFVVAPSNLSWFAFVAGDTTIEFNVAVKDCVPGVRPEMGVQGGLLAGCDTKDGRILDSLVLDCYAPGGNTLSDFTIMSNELVVGQVYYFFIDGYAGTRCTYTIDVINAKQPFELEDPTAIVASTSNQDIDTICLGTRNVNLNPNSPRLDINYFWRIDPPLNSYPTAFTDLGYNTRWNFTSAGTYNIYVYADNGCDQTDTIVKTIVVRQEPDEVFDTVGVCWNEFPYDGPLLDDPNGDGVIGWLGPPIVYPGGYVEHNVIRADGCTYTQVLTVNELSRKARADVNLVSCGPIDYYGTLITTNTSNLDLSIPNANSEGCDSLVRVNAIITDLEGTIAIQNCDNNGLTIGLTITSISAPSGYTLDIRWFDSTGQLIDDDTNPMDIKINKRESYFAEVDLIIGTDTCMFFIDPTLIDPDDTKPSLTAVDWPIDICNDDNIGTFRITSDQPLKDIQWTFPAGAVIINASANNDQITVDFSNSSSGLVQVNAENYCSGTNSINANIRLVEAPSASFDMPMAICLDSLVDLTYTGTTNTAFTYRWQLPTNAVLINGSSNNPGPISFLMPSGTGNVVVGIVVSNGACIDSFNQNLQILPAIEPLDITCNNTANSVTFSWTDEDCAASYDIYRGNTLIENTTNNSITFQDLGNQEVVNISIVTNSDCACSAPISLASCQTKDCQGVTVNAITPINNLCEADWISDIPLNYSVMPSIGSNGNISWDSPFVTDDSFDGIAAGAGTFPVVLQLEDNGCTYSDTAFITLYAAPALNLQVEDPACIEDEFGIVNISLLGGNLQNHTFTLNNETVNPGFNFVPIGNHIIEVIDANTCNTIQTFTIDPPFEFSYNITYDDEIYENQSMNIEFSYGGGELSLIDSIVWLVNGEIVCNGPECFEFDLNSPEPGIYRHRIFIFYNNGCEMVENLDIRVQEITKVKVANAFKSSDNSLSKYWNISTNDPTLVIDQVSIVDRWGNKVFDRRNFVASNETQLWDGTFNGELLEPGVYVVLLRYEDEFGKMIQRNFDLTLIR